MKRIGIIGGSGLYEMDGVTGIEEITVSTPFGEPSDAVLCGQLDGVPVAFLPRHGRGHRFSPSDLNYRANIYALKSIGVDFILSVSATGSMREEIEPGHFVLVDQFIDRTRGHRAHTFFGDGCVGHVGFGDPTCKSLVSTLAEVAGKTDIPHHVGGTYVCIEGPQFSTRAESETYRGWDVSVIGMTNLTEAKLAREAEIHYATIAMATDYDVWHPSEEDVSVEAVIATAKANAGKAQRLLRDAVPRVAALRDQDLACPCGGSLKFAVMTDPALIPPATKEKLSLFLGKYWS